MTSEPSDGSPDPWAVVEHHARQAAARSPAGSLTAGQRLAMYVTAAPEVIGARPMTAAETGWLGPVRGSTERWVAAAPGGGQVAWDAEGNCFVPAAPRQKRLLIAGFGFLLSTVGFARISGPRAVFAGLMVGFALFLLTRHVFSPWRALGSSPDDARYNAVFAELAARYEAGV